MTVNEERYGHITVPAGGFNGWIKEAMTDDHKVFTHPPAIVGYWKMPCGTVSFATTSKPRWLTRFLMKHLMQWEWRDT